LSALQKRAAFQTLDLDPTRFDLSLTGILRGSVYRRGNAGKVRKAGSSGCRGHLLRVKWILKC